MTAVERNEMLRQAASLIKTVYAEVQYSSPLELALDDVLMAMSGAQFESERVLKRLKGEI